MATGVTSPAQAGSPAEGKQVAALAALVSLGSCPEAGLLGGGWVVIMRVLSSLEALQVHALPPPNACVLVHDARPRCVLC